MEWQHRFEQAKTRLLSDEAICPDNRALFAQFFEFEEYKLKRQNGLSALDEPCYKTLYGYIMRFQNVNRWFENKPWTQITKTDVKRVYDGLEDGTIRTKAGLPFQDRMSYYHKVFRSKPFRLAGKVDLAKEVIEFSIAQRREVRYATLEVFQKLVSVISNPRHLFLLWLAWDVGENIGTLLKLTKNDFLPQIDHANGGCEYLVRLPRSKLKRSRQERTEPLLFPETNRFAEIVLGPLQSHELIFPVGYASATKVLRRAVRRSRATTMPHGAPVRWKDLRSGMACHLLKWGWSRDEVNARLGHTPRSAALDAYINYLALDRQQSKERLRRSLVGAPPLNPVAPLMTTPPVQREEMRGWVSHEVPRQTQVQPIAPAPPRSLAPAPGNAPSESAIAEVHHENTVLRSELAFALQELARLRQERFGLAAARSRHQVDAAA